MRADAHGEGRGVLVPVPAPVAHAHPELVLARRDVRVLGDALGTGRHPVGVEALEAVGELEPLRRGKGQRGEMELEAAGLRPQVHGAARRHRLAVHQPLLDDGGGAGRGRAAAAGSMATTPTALGNHSLPSGAFHAAGTRR